VIAAIDVVVSVVVVSRTTNQSILLPLVASHIASLVTHEPAVRAVIAPLLANRPLALAQDSRLVACNLSRFDSAPDTHPITAATTLRRRHICRSQQRTYRAQKKKPFHFLRPFPFKLKFFD
jgi:hypothetical protein